jgi:hypothetical protein
MAQHLDLRGRGEDTRSRSEVVKTAMIVAVVGLQRSTGCHVLGVSRRQGGGMHVRSAQSRASVSQCSLQVLPPGSFSCHVTDDFV